MEKGQMRVEVNISLQKGSKMGTKVEIKNLNSFRAVEKSIDYEIDRQKDVLDSGEKVIQETRGWNESLQKTFSQRSKEQAHDYRYFPEPDLPPLVLEAAKINILKKQLPELPQERKQRFVDEYKISDLAVDFLTGQISEGKMYLADFFENAVSELDNWLKHRQKKIDAKRKQQLTKLMSNYMMTEFPKYLQEGKHSLSKITAENYAEFVDLIDKGEISSSAAQAVLAEMFKTGADPSHIVADKGLKQLSDKSELDSVIQQILDDNPQSVKDYLSGKEQALQFLIGQVMKATKGQANPQVVGPMLKEKIK
jgi:aspartyl-tRNA(Asn)/glutamyl-tRNA(Gln) amidotransferase subunit B